MFSYARKFNISISYRFPNGTVKHLEMNRINQSYFEIPSFVNVENRVYNLSLVFLDHENQTISVKYFRENPLNVSYQSIEDQKISQRVDLDQTQ